MIIDTSADQTFDNCSGEWYEKYINNRRKRWPKAQRDDALALGSLVHEGLRIWQQQHIIQIPAQIIDEINPTLECLQIATELVHGYAVHYPSENWPLIQCEEPLTFPLGSYTSCALCSRNGFSQCMEHLTGLAKIDAYFYVPEYTSIPSGLPDGTPLHLEPGWYIHEYKTKSPDVNHALYMQGWEMNIQASYQILALQHKFNAEHDAHVNGVLVNVLEKPKRYIP